MARKRAKISKDAIVDTSSHTKNLLVATVALLSALLILNIVSLTGFTVNKRDYSPQFFGDDTCGMLGGIVLREGASANHNGQRVMLVSTNEDVISVNVDGDVKAIKAGHDSYINGFSIKNFAANENDACLIL